LGLPQVNRRRCILPARRGIQQPPVDLLRPPPPSTVRKLTDPVFPLALLLTSHLSLTGHLPLIKLKTYKSTGRTRSHPLRRFAQVLHPVHPRPTRARKYASLFQHPLCLDQSLWGIREDEVD